MVDARQHTLKGFLWDPWRRIAGHQNTHTAARAIPEVASVLTSMLAWLASLLMSLLLIFLSPCIGMRSHPLCSRACNRAIFSAIIPIGCSRC